MGKYYTAREVSEGIDELPPISPMTLRNLRSKRKIKYTRLGRECLYRKDWLEEYLNRNIVEAKRG